VVTLPQRTPSRLAAPQAAKPKRAVLFDVDAMRRRRRPPRQTMLQWGEGSAPRLLSADELVQTHGLGAAVARMDVDAAAEHTFDGGRVGAEQMRAQLIERGADGALCSLDYVRNHYALVVWKLASLERAFPDKARGALSRRAVFDELCYRYEREVNRAERSALRKIVERDESSSRHMVLCVTKTLSVSRIEVSDGWYRLAAALDDGLASVLGRGGIFVGQKLRVFGAALIGSGDAASPLEIENYATLLQLSMNGTRRCAWHVSLGAQREPTFSVPLRSIVPDGGFVGAVDIVVQRVYPLLFMETSEAGGSDGDSANAVRVVRSERAEDSARAMHERKAELRVAAKREELMRLAAANESNAPRQQQQPALPASASFRNKRQRTGRQAGDGGDDLEQLFAQMTRSPDPESFAQHLSDDRRGELMHYREQRQREQVDALNAKLQEFVATEPGLAREVAPFLRVLVTDCRQVGLSAATTHAHLTIWRPSEAHRSAFVEGARLRLYGLSARASGDATLQLSTTAATKWQERTATPAERLRIVARKPIARFDELANIEFGEGGELDRHVDIVGVLVAVGPVHRRQFANGRQYNYQAVFVSDTRSLLVAELRGDELSFPLSDADGFPVVALRNCHYHCYDARASLQVVKADNCTEMACSARALSKYGSMARRVEAQRAKAQDALGEFARQARALLLDRQQQQQQPAQVSRHLQFNSQTADDDDDDDQEETPCSADIMPKLEPVIGNVRWPRSLAKLSALLDDAEQCSLAIAVDDGVSAWPVALDVGATYAIVRGGLMSIDASIRSALHEWLDMLFGVAPPRGGSPSALLTSCAPLDSFDALLDDDDLHDVLLRKCKASDLKALLVEHKLSPQGAKHVLATRLIARWQRVHALWQRECGERLAPIYERIVAMHNVDALLSPSPPPTPSPSPSSSSPLGRSKTLTYRVIALLHAVLAHGVNAFESVACAQPKRVESRCIAAAVAGAASPLCFVSCELDYFEQALAHIVSLPTFEFELERGQSGGGHTFSVKRATWLRTENRVKQLLASLANTLTPVKELDPQHDALDESILLEMMKDDEAQ
jgi:BRCA2, oligonucleotide/oligosaccharide-binding, domain 1/BRCA2, helical